MKTTFLTILACIVFSASIAQEKKSIMAADLMKYKVRGLDETLLKEASDYVNEKKAGIECLTILTNEQRDKLASDAGYFTAWDSMNQRTASGMIANVNADGYMTFGILNGEEGQVKVSMAFQLKGSALNYWSESTEPTIDGIKKAYDIIFSKVCP